MLRSIKRRVGIFLIALAIPGISGVTNQGLTNVVAIMSLINDHVTQSTPISITGVVTLAESAWGGSFFVIRAKEPAGRIVSKHTTTQVQWPSWWTVERLLIGLGIVLSVSLAAITCALRTRRKNAALKSSIAEKIKAQEELQKAHYQLESRVEERTRELKFEMSARKEAEVRCDAIVAERTRLAQELHDTLLQGFTGIGLKLDVLRNKLPPTLASEKEQLEKILEQSDEYLIEARRAVWELRSPVLERLGDFSKALPKVSERALRGTDIQLRFKTAGDARKITPAVEDHLLRICEEAVTNSVRHARPAQVEVHLEYASNELQLRIKDDGCGFDPTGLSAVKNGHFGLIGIRERVKSLEGNILLKSQPGRGTEIRVTVPLPT